MSVKDCIRSAADQNEISRDEADALSSLYDSLLRHYGSADKAKAELVERLMRQAETQKRQAGLSAEVREKLETFVLSFKDARGQYDPAKAIVFLLENHGQVKLPAGAMNVVAHAKAIMNLALTDLEALLHEFRPQLLTGKTRNRALLDNVVREAAGEGTGDAAAKAFAAAWLKVADGLRERFNAAGGAIAALDGWFLPQVHDAGALIAAGRDRWKAFIRERLDLGRMRHHATGLPMTREDLEESLDWIWQNITSNGHGSAAENAAEPFGGVKAVRGGIGALANQRQDHRFLHFKDARGWMEYQAAFGGGADPFRAMMEHVRGMSEDIAAMEVLSPNPPAMLNYLANFATKQAALARPVKVMVREAVARIKALNAELDNTPTRLDEIAERTGEIAVELDRLRRKYAPQLGGKPTQRTKARIEALQKEWFDLDQQRIEIEALDPLLQSQQGAVIADKLKAEYDALSDLQGARPYFPERTEFLGRQIGGEGRWSTDASDYANGQIYRARTMWGLFRGEYGAVNAKAANRAQSVRNFNVLSKLGGALLSSAADIATEANARYFAGLPTTGVIKSVLANYGTTAKREAHRASLIADTYLHMFNEGARLGAAFQGATWTRVLSERVIALQGLDAWTRSRRSGFGLAAMGIAAEVAARDWKALGEGGTGERNFRRMLERYGLTERDWDTIRLDPSTGTPRDADFIRPKDLEVEARAAGREGERLAERYLGMILQESDFASPQSMLRASAAMRGQTRAGTLIGELARFGWQFKSFGVMIGLLHIERMAREIVEQGGWRGAPYAVAATLSLMLAGALSIQLKELAYGKDPRPMDSRQFWGAALLQSGGLGLYGDFFAAETSRMGGGLAGSLAGPTVGLLSDIGNLTVEPAYKAMKGEKTHVGRDAATMIGRYTPGSSIWYLRAAWNRMFVDQLQRQLDPEAYDAFRRKQQQQLKDYGNGFWWRPGEASPSRGPRFDRMVR